MSTALRSVGLLDVLSSTPAETSRRAPCNHARLRRLATKPGEKCGLARVLSKAAASCRDAASRSFAKAATNRRTPNALRAPIVSLGSENYAALEKFGNVYLVYLIAGFRNSVNEVDVPEFSQNPVLTKLRADRSLVTFPS